SSKTRNKNYSNFSIEKLAKSKKISKRSSKTRNKNYSNFSIEKLAKSKKISKRSSKTRNKNYSNFSKQRMFIQIINIKLTKYLYKVMV
ncbi:MAG: hypothetical protein AABX88_02935, partial [Nanoarchaeota archaeon]